MSSATLAASAAFAVASAMLYFVVGAVVRNRVVNDDEELPNAGFVAWWWGLAASTLIGAGLTLTAAAGYTSLRLWLATTFVNLLLICIALGGLLYYLGYLFTGRRSLWVPLTIFYLVYFGLLADFILAGDPVGVLVERWQVSIDYATDTAGSLLFAIVILLLIGPQIVGALAYFTLFFRVDDRTSRYRVALVSWSIIFWFSSSLVASFSTLGDQDWWQIASRFIALAAATTVLVAYRPPRWIRETFHVKSVEARAKPTRSDG